MSEKAFQKTDSFNEAEFQKHAEEGFPHESLAGYRKAYVLGARCAWRKSQWRHEELLSKAREEARKERSAEIEALRARVSSCEATLEQIANIDFRGNRSQESNIAFRALRASAPAEDKGER